MKGVTSNNVTVSWNSTILREKGIERLFLGYTSTNSKGKHRKLSGFVESESMTIRSLSPFTEYRLTMREGNKNNPPIGLGKIKTWPTGIPHLFIS